MVKRQGLWVVAALVVVGCGPSTVPCGTFDFTGAPHASRGITMSLDFDFDPATCGAPACTCGTVAWVQIVRIVDLQTGNFLSPNGDQTNRMVTGRSDAWLNGWAIDRLAGRVWGYYGRNNNGTFASYVTTGTNATDAVLGDTPSGWPDRSWFDAVSVPVCIDAAASCSDELTGFYYWLFTVGVGGTVGDPFDKVAVEWHRDAFDESVIEWDVDAPGLGKNTFPAFTRMP